MKYIIYFIIFWFILRTISGKVKILKNAATIQNQSPKQGQIEEAQWEEIK